ncbi:MAG TPA: hypothetical protein VM942_05510 [Acidimicrobiales bacterium]|nr:hypothetical protein [Acidimicrobiales bacterium]
MGVLVAGAMLATSPVRVAAQLSTQPFAAYGNASTLQVNAVQALLGGPPLANVNAALSAGVVNSTGLNALVQNQFGNAVGPPQPGKNAYGRGSGLELGISPLTGEQNALILSGVAQANAPPPSPLVTEEIEIAVPGVLTASTLRGQAQATYDPLFCPVGRPLTYGLGYAENLQLLPGSIGGLVGTSATGDSVSQTRTVTYLVPNGDGTYGVRAESEAIIAPVSVAGTGITIEIAGPVGFRVTATGKPDSQILPGFPRNGVEYTDTPVITVRLMGVPLPGTPVTLQDILGPNGLEIDIPLLASVAIGAPPEGLSGTGEPSVAADGTSASASLDIVRLKLLPLVGLLDTSIGHFEGAVSAPAGGVRCNLPVSKIATPDPVQVGQEVVFTISIPSDPGLFNALFACDLVNIRAVDTVEVASGNVGFTILGADRGGVIGPANVVTFPDLGSYALGDPPIQVNIRVRIDSASGDPAILRDRVKVDALLGNCRGRAAGDDLVIGSGLIEGSAITGEFVLIGPTIAGGRLAATGGTSAPLVVGGALVLGGLGLVRLRRRLIQRRV